MNLSLNNDEKQIIANKIKCISETDMKNDYEKLKKMATEANAVDFNERCLVGNNVVDFFTFRERLETRGKYNINFYDFISNIEEFKKKKFKYYGYDLSSTMIKIAKKKNNLKNLSFKLGDINKINFKKKSDLFLSILTFPFLNSNQRIALYKKIYDSLNYGGAMIFVDKIRSSKSVYEDMFNQVYFDFKIDSKLKHKQILNKSKSIRSAMQLFQIKEITSFLKKTGFEKNEVFFRWFNFVGIIAVK
jgi:ubiquinone/menaquinone biosynthesis C-methylase UbiE